ncbi:MAG TPA: DUF5683 domain-containing protein [Pedobacter sp.]|uniref:DUF5683 domain-containing protein n=1 Tax=Pedobacter sp. TaxID=1411316 RepID=UPI002BD768DF|nr:DUF5683 domain-containing protein [Pedobacter sp.]HMI04411.1 DUF5683 domain-containing protein [Pedobacter sp.]
MRNFFLLSVLVFFSALSLKAQQPVSIKKDSTAQTIQKTDTLKKRPAYINPGKVAGKKAAFRSMILPGMGQLGNGVTVYRLAKVAGIYTGATLLTLSYIENNNNYKIVLKELEFRVLHPGERNPEGFLQDRQQDGLILAKDTFRRNREVIVFSFVGLYLLNVVEAYIDARLKYFDVGDIAFKVSPGIIDANTMYGFNQPVPGIKLTLKF